MKNLSLRAKLYLLSGFLLMIPIVVGGICYWSTQNIITHYSKVTTWNLPGTRSIYEVLMDNRQARLNAYQLVQPGLSKERAKKISGEIENVWKELDEDVKDYLKVPFGPGEAQMWAALKEPIDSGRKATLKLVELYRKNPDENSAERKEMLRTIVEEMNPSSAKTRAAGNALREYHEKNAKLNIAAAQKAASEGILYSIIALVASVAIGVGFVIFFANHLVKTLTAISDSLAAAGVNVGTGAAQIADASQALSQATTEQAASLEETAASIEEMNSMISKNADNAQKSSTISKTSQSNAQRGQDTVKQMIQSIDDISTANNNIMTQVNHSNEQMAEIVKVITEIGNKTKVINDIVFQTKLLSFNASVEAARAGENGKGFAVVAEEVGNLAQMSGNAAAEIKTMLDDSIRKVEGIVNQTKSSVTQLVDEGKKKVETGTHIAQSCGQVLEEIVGNVSNVSNMSEEISTASIEQSQGIKEITKAMHSLDQVTHQNSTTSEQAAHTAAELSEQAESLNKLVLELVKAVQGSSGQAKTPVKTALKAPKKVEKQAEKKAEVKTDKKPEASKVIAFKAKPAESAGPTPMKAKKASGESLPYYDDKRFDDV